MPRPETIRALVRAALRGRLPVFHALFSEAKVIGLNRGTDVLAHRVEPDGCEIGKCACAEVDGQIGTVRVGKRANLLLLKQDPTRTIEAYADIVKVILAGRLLDRAQLAANRDGP